MLRVASFVAAFALAWLGPISSAPFASAQACPVYAGCVATTTKISAPDTVKRGAKALVKIVVKAGNSEPQGKVTMTIKGKGYSFVKTVKYTGGKVTITSSKLKKAGMYKVTVKFDGASDSRWLDSKDTDSIKVK